MSFRVRESEPEEPDDVIPAGDRFVRLGLLSHPAPSPGRRPMATPEQQQHADEGLPEAVALLEAKQSGDWKAIRLAMRAYEGMLRDSGRKPAVPGPPGEFSVFNQGMKVREKHYTR